MGTLVKRGSTVLWTSGFVAGFVLTVGAIYFYIGQIFAAAAAVGALALPLMRLLFPHRFERTAPFIRGIFSRNRTAAAATILIWLCFVGILVAAGELVLSPFVEHHQLRSEPKTLTRDTIRQLVVNRGLFDSHLNPSGRGITNLFSRFDINAAEVIRDKSTGLMWEYSKVERFVSYSDAEAHIPKLNNKKWGNFQDWRLPTIEEAYSILEPTPKKIDKYTLHLNPILGESHPFIWTADFDPDQNEPWVVSYLTGDTIVNVTNNITRKYEFAVRAVRSTRRASK